MAYHIKTTGEVIPVKGLRFSLTQLQNFVGGYIEIVYRLLPMTLSSGNGHPIEIKSHVMVVNEEGQLKDLPHNPMATVIAGRPIVGDVLVCYRSQIR